MECYGALAGSVSAPAATNETFQRMVSFSRSCPSSILWIRTRVSLHRHTCATLLLPAGENPKVVSERLGHSTITLTTNMQQRAAKKLEAMLFSATR